MISDEFVLQLRSVFQAQKHLLGRITQRLEEVEGVLAPSAGQARQLAELELLMADLEQNADLLDADDLDDFDPDAVMALYQSKQQSLQTELRRIGFTDWKSFVCQCTAYNVEHGLDPLLPYEAFLSEDDHRRLATEAYEHQYRWDRWDYTFVGAAGLIAALTDVFLVRIPHSMKYLRTYDQQGSPLTAWLKGYHPQGRTDFFSTWVTDLESRCKVPFDRQFAVISGQAQAIPGMYAGTHRFQSLGHDPLLGLVVGVVDILRSTLTGFSYDKLTGLHAPIVGAVWSSIDQVPLIEAILTQIGHLLSDAFTKMGLPAPLLPLLQFFNVGSFGEKGRSLAEVARWMYREGYDLRHFLVSGITPGVIEIILRAYIMVRHYAEHGATPFLLAGNPKYRSMLLAGHSIAALANAGKVALFQGNPLAINYAEWLALFRYLIPSVKYWVFDRARLKLEHIERLNDAEWSELEQQTSRILQAVAGPGMSPVVLGLN